MLVVILCLVIAVILFVIKYEQYTMRKKDKQLLWLDTVPGYPFIGNLFEFHGPRETLNDLRHLHATYGKTMLIRAPLQRMILSCDYDFLEFVLSSPKILDKSGEYKFLHRWLGTGLLTSDGPKWKTRRKLLTPSFHFSILQKFVASFESNGNILVEKLRTVQGKDINIYQYITLYTLDIICESAMGVSVNAQEVEDSQYVKNVKFLCRRINERATTFYERPDLLYRLSPNYYREKKAVKQIHNFTYSVIDSRIKTLQNSTNDQNNTEGKAVPFLDMLLKSTVDGRPLTREEIREEVDTFMFEGHDTAGSAISFALYLLASHQDVQDHALEEQKTIFCKDIHRPSTYNDLQQMKYLECVIKETLRLYPSVPFYGRKTDQPVIYKGNVMPEDIDIAVIAYELQRDPKYFPNPDKFDPTRFETMDGTNPYCFIPFSAGPRNCIGQKFAMLEMKSALSKILRAFRLLPTVPEHQLKLTSEAVLKSYNGIYIRVLKRTF
ncbi:unnamed protein product [Callosobruchus maculatus]|uniref:Cytochrome P450 n=1 Tax=Callosobruchus maculatus TaxID=64391 RepID=A0A653D4H9_CALMS|nr:unnamed protein product [Callosobruchus maculatus]